MSSIRVWRNVTWADTQLHCTATRRSPALGRLRRTSLPVAPIPSFIEQVEAAAAAPASDAASLKTRPIGLMQLTGLKYFVAVAEHGSFSAAGEWLGVSVSTLTRSVATLEEDLGLSLFERSKQGVALTPAAAPVLTETRRMLASLHTVTEVAAGAARVTVGELRLGVRSPPVGEPLRGMLARWREGHSAVRLVVHELPDLELFSELVARRIDVALIPSYAPWPRIVMEPLYSEAMVAAVPQEHPLAQRGSLRWSDLLGENIYVQDWAQSHAMREFYARMMGPGMPLNPVPAGKQTIFSLVAAGFGVTLAQKSQAEVNFPGVAFVPIDEPSARVEFSLAWSPHSECSIIGRFLCSMRSSAKSKGVAPPDM